MRHYENRVVLFLDILGFQKIIEDTISKGIDRAEHIEKLYETLRLIREEVSQMKSGTSRVVTQFSDTVVVSFQENDTKEITIFFQSILTLVMKLISREIICRGAISYGKLIHTNDCVFGPALNDAYLTESSAALYPRIILDKSIVDTLKANYKDKIPDMLSVMRMESKVNAFLEIDTDDKLYLDYFTGALSMPKDKTILDYFVTLRKIISNGQRYTSPSIKIKYGWMKNKYNKFFDDLPSIQYENELYYPSLNALAKMGKIK